jgi:hypothetical protein
LRIEGNTKMNDIYCSSPILLAHVLIEEDSGLYAYLAVISLFVFGLLLFRIFGRTPKGSFISSFISYVLLLINILGFSFGVRIPIEVLVPCFVVGMWPSLYIVGFIGELTERLFGPVSFPAYWLLDYHTSFLCLVAFSINTLCIFAIIQLILYIKHKVSAKKPNLHTAIIKGDSKTVLNLIVRGADVNCRSVDGTSSLHSACALGQIECVKILLEHGANIEARDARNNTPLSIAALAGQPEIVELLLAHGARTDVKNDKGRTPLQAVLAFKEALSSNSIINAAASEQKKKLDRCAEVLIQHGSK